DGGREAVGMRIDVRVLSPKLRKTAECVSGLLKSMSGVQDVRLGALRNHIRAFAVIDYDIVDQAGASRTVEFALWNPGYPGADAIYDTGDASGLAVSDEPLFKD